MSGYESSTLLDPDLPNDISGIRISYAESGCYGKCPVFSMEISDGLLTFSGRNYVRAKGKKTAHLKPDEFARIVRAWYDGRFYAMRDDYCMPKCPDGTITIITDVPEYSVSFTSSELHKDVNYCAAYLNGNPETPVPPDAFREFQKMMRALAKSHKWL